MATLLFYMGKTDAGGATVFIDGGVRLPPTQVSQQRTLHFLSGIVILSLLCLRSPHLIDFLHVKKHVIEFFVCGALKALCVSNVHKLAVFICFFSQKMKLFYSFLPPLPHPIKWRCLFPIYFLFPPKFGGFSLVLFTKSGGNSIISILWKVGLFSEHVIPKNGGFYLFLYPRKRFPPYPENGGEGDGKFSIIGRVTHLLLNSPFP